MQAIKKKLRSQRGASITFALLIFLVCAVLSSVIIVAASTAAGRMSKLAETDRRYYAVTSAAELMKDLLKEPVTIVDRTEVTNVSRTTTTKIVKETEKIVPTEVINDDGEPVIENTVITETETNWINHGTVAEEPLKETKIYLLLKEAKDIKEAEDYIPTKQISGEGAMGIGLPTASLVNDAAYKVYNGKNESTKLEREKIQIKPSANTIQEVEMVEKLMPKAEDRLLILTISNPKSDSDPKSQQYTLELHFQGTQDDQPVDQGPTTTKTLDSEPTVDIKTETYETVEDGVTIQVTVKTTTTTMVTTKTSKRTDTSISTINWDLVDIRTKTSS